MTWATPGSPNYYLHICILTNFQKVLDENLTKLRREQVVVSDKVQRKLLPQVGILKMPDVQN
jgi:hypothetical protein